MKEYDAIIIGVGQAGSPLASALVKKDYNIAVIEKSEPGGSCVNYGCTPTKTMIASSSLAAWVRRGDEYGINFSGFDINFDKIRERRDEIVKESREGLEKFLKDTDNINYYNGLATFKNENVITVNNEDLFANWIFINTGTSPLIPDIEGIRDVPYFTAKTMMDLDKIPEHLIIIGGGYIGLEYGQMMRNFGAHVTILDHAKHIVPREDEDVCQELTKIMTDDGIKIINEAEATQLSGKEGNITVKTKDGSYKGSHLLIAAGTVPNTRELNLHNAGVKTNDKGYVEVNDKLQTSRPHIYAMGDVKGGPEFTHISFDDYRVVQTNLLSDGERSIKDRLVPYCMFTNPQLGRVGLNEKMAKKQKIDYEIAKMPTSSSARGKETGFTRGFFKVLIDSTTDKILGATIIASEGGEISSMIQFAMMGGVTWQELRDTAIAHPTYAESLNNLFQKI